MAPTIEGSNAPSCGGADACGVSEIFLSPEEAQCITQLAHELSLAASPSADPPAFCAQARALSQRLPERVRRLLKVFAEKGSPTGFILVHLIEVDDEALGSTPPGNIYK